MKIHPKKDRKFLDRNHFYLFENGKLVKRIGDTKCGLKACLCRLAGKEVPQMDGFYTKFDDFKTVLKEKKYAVVRYQKEDSEAFENASKLPQFSDVAFMKVDMLGPDAKKFKEDFKELLINNTYFYEN